MFLGRKDLWIYVLVDDIEQINLCNLSEFDEWKKWNGKIYIYLYIYIYGKQVFVTYKVILWNC